MSTITKTDLQTLLTGLNCSSSVRNELFDLIIESDMTSEQATKLVDMLEPLVFKINEVAKDNAEAEIEEARDEVREIEDDRDILEHDLVRTEGDLETAISCLKEISSIANDQIDVLEPYKIKVAIGSMKVLKKIQKLANSGVSI